MTREREPRSRVRQGQKVRAESIVKSDTASITSDLLQQDNLPEHLAAQKEHYEATIVADEVLKRTRIKAQETLATLGTVMKDALMTTNDNTTATVNYLNEQPMRQDQREFYTGSVDAVDDIVVGAMLDGLEETGDLINRNNDTSPKSRRKTRVLRERRLTLEERLSGKIVEET